MVFISGSMFEIYFTQRLHKKQVNNVSLVFKDSDTDSENLSFFIWLSVSDGQKISSNVVSLKGIS